MGRWQKWACSRCVTYLESIATINKPLQIRVLQRVFYSATILPCILVELSAPIPEINFCFSYLFRLVIYTYKQGRRWCRRVCLPSIYIYILWTCLRALLCVVLCVGLVYGYQISQGLYMSNLYRDFNGICFSHLFFFFFSFLFLLPLPP